MKGRSITTSFYSVQELGELGFRAIGRDALISRKSSFYGAANMTIGNCVRIDDFCVLSGKIDIGDHVHIACYSALFGGTKGITLHDYCGLSCRSTVYAVNDDYSGSALTGPTVPDALRSVT